MRLRESKVKGLPVETEAGDSVGRISGMMIDSESHMVIQYLVSKSRLLPALLPDELAVHYTQVITLDDTKMVVKGGLTEIEAQAKTFQKQVRDAAAGAISTTASTTEMRREGA